MKDYHLIVRGWAAFSPALASSQDWQAWACGDEVPLPEIPYKPELPMVPAMLRRRLSGIGKAALWTAYQLIDADTAMTATIFCSRHGEVNRTVGMLQNLAADQPLSPASFSLSVHNAIGGIYSIASKITTSITALSAGEDGICATLLEAYAVLSSADEGAEVLCVVYDDPLPAPFASGQSAPSAVQALALRVSLQSGSDAIPLSLTLSASQERLASERVTDQFLRFLLNERSEEICLGIDYRQWRWRKDQMGQAGE